MRRICIICIGWLTAAATAPADVIWSGSMYQRTYHDVPAIDFNLDGTDDFTFNLTINTLVGIYYEYSIEPANGQIVVEKISETLRGGGYPLAYGTEISASLNVSGPVDVAWDASETTLFLYGTPDVGEEDYGGWFSQYPGYLGVSFDGDGATHYGWIELSHDRTRPDPLNKSLMIHGWAWETEADTPITAGVIPEPSTGILTMVGSLGLLLFTRSRRTEKPTRSSRIRNASNPPEEWR